MPRRWTEYSTRAAHIAARQAHAAQARALPFQQARAPFHRLRHLRRDALAEHLLRQRDGQPAHARAQRLHIPAARPPCACHVPHVMPAERFQHPGGIGHRAGQRANLIHGGREGDQPPARNRAIRRPHAHHAAQRRRLADGAAGIRPQRKRRFPGSHGRRRTARTAARHARQVPRIARAPQRRMLRAGAHGEFVQVGFAQHHRARRLQAFHRGGVIGRTVVGQQLRGAGCAHPPRAEVVFVGGRDARERPRRQPPRRRASTARACASASSSVTVR